eukprot:gene21646-27686_t
MDPTDHYKFTINDTVPTGLTTNDYLTLSRNGILQSTSDGNTELLSYPSLMRDHDIYHKLKKIPIFRLFRLWKPFGMWRRTVRSQKMTLMGKQLNSSLCLLNEFYQKQIVVVTQQCAALRQMVILRLKDVGIYDMDMYVETQRTMQKQCKELQSSLLHSLLAHLCREGENHAYNALTKVPEAISQLHFNVGATTQPTVSPRGKKSAIAAAMGESLRAKFNKPTQKSTNAAAAMLSTFGDFDSETLPPTGLDTFSSTTMDSSANKWAGMLGGSLGPTQQIHNVSYTERASIRINCRRLAAFLRLVDYMVRDALYDCVEAALTALSKCLSGTVLKRGELPQPVPDMTLFLDSTAMGLTKVPTRGRDATALFKLTVVLKNDGVSGSGESTDGLDSPQRSPTQQLPSGGGFALLPTAAKRFTISINPVKPIVMEKFRGVVTDTLRVASYVEGAFFDPQVVEVLVSIATELSTLQLEDIVFQDKDNSVGRLMEACCSTVASDFDACQGHVLKYRFMCLQYEKNAKLLAAAETSKLFDMSPEQMVAELIEFEASLVACAEITDFQDLGVFRLEFPLFKKNISAMIINCKTQFYRLIPELYVANGDRFYAELAKLNDVLSTKPVTLEQFVKVVDVFNKATADAERLQSSFNYIIAIRDILDSRGIPKTEAILRQNLTISTVWGNFNRFMGEFDEQLDDNNKVYLKEMKTRTRILLEPIDRAKEYLQSEAVNSPESEPDVILGELTNIKRNMEIVRKRGAEIEAFQDVLKFSVFSRSVVSNMLDEIQSDFLLWSIVKLVKELQVSFMSVHFLDAESDEVERQLRYATVTITQKVSQSANAPVMAWLTQALEELQFVAPIIKKLQSKTRREIHTQRIQAILGRAIFDTQQDTTVGELVTEVGIKEHVAALDEIYEESLFQYNLECQVADLQKACNAQEFQFGADRDNKSLVFFSSLKALAVFFEDALISLNACIASKFSAPHSAAFHVFQEQLQSCLQVNESLKILQDGYLRIRVLFTSARTARYLSQSLKYFKILDEIWRSVMKLARFDSKVMLLYGTDKVREDLAEALVAIAATDANTKTYVFEQCMRWPKLFLLDQSDVLEIFATQDPRKTFVKCRSLFANLTDIHFDEREPFNAVAVSSHEELLEFKKHCSARNSLVDWMKAIDAALSDKLADEIREYMFENRTLLDDLRIPKTCEQSRVCFVQIKFWWDVVDNMGKGSRHRMALRPQLQELSDQMVMYCSMLSNYSAKYQIKTMANMLVLLAAHRDLLQLLLADPDGEASETTFALDASLKKHYHIPSATLTVKQGPFTSEYGMKYNGFGERLVITPLTDKCFMALSTAMAECAVSVLQGPVGVGKRSTMAALTYELGLEAVALDCRQIRGPDNLYEVLRAVLGMGLWLNVNHFDQLTAGMTSVFLTVLSAVQTALRGNVDKMFLAGDLIDITQVPGSKPRVCIILNRDSHWNNGLFLPASVRLQFRPINFQGPSRRAILTVILSSYNFASVSRLALRLDGLCGYIQTHKLVGDAVVLRVILESIRIVGERNDHTPAALPLQVTAIAKQLFLRIPGHLQDRVTEFDLRFICNLFLEVVFTGSSGGDHDLTTFRNVPPCTSYADILHSHLLHSVSPSLIIVGPPAVGKSQLIRSTLRKTADEHNAEIDRIELKKYGKKPAAPLVRMEVVDRVLNPFVMADFTPSEGSQRARTVCPQALSLAAEGVIEGFVSAVDPLGPQQLVHIDTQSSLQLSVLMSRAVYSAQRHSRSIKFVWECPELSNLDPAMVCSAPILFVRDKNFTVQDVIEAHAERLSISEAKVFRLLLTNCIDVYIKPCVAQYPSDAFHSQITLVDNLFRMIGSLLRASGISSTAGGSKWSEDSVRRVVVCSCIWTFGVCSPSNKERFDGWFREQFDVDAERTKDKHIYPNNSGRSVYDSYLNQPDESRVELEWAVFHKKPPSSSGGAQQTQSSIRNSSEERLRTSYANLYYTTIFSGAEGGSSLLIPTATAQAYAFIQACLMESGGHVLVTGSKGAGKSSLMRELVEISKRISTDKASLATASRWVCRTTDCGPKKLQSHIERCRSSLYPLLMERQLPDKGSVFVEDVNIKLHTDSHVTCAEFIRSLCEGREMFNIARQIWQPASKTYTLLCADNSPGYLNERFVRHQMVLCCEPEELRSIFVQKIQTECSVLRDDLADDLVKITFVMLDALRRSLRYFVISSSTNSCADFEKLSKPDQMYLMSCYTRSVSSSADHILSMTARAMPSLTVFSANDAVKIWDRVVADYSVRHPVLSTLLNAALDSASSEHSYLFPAFSSIVDREKLIRITTGESLATGGPLAAMGTAVPTLEYPLSYMRNASGFFKTGPGVFAGISTAEYLRDSYAKKYGRETIPAGLDADSLALWTDVMAIASRVGCFSITGGREVLFLSGCSPTVTAKVTQLACIVSQMTFRQVCETTTSSSEGLVDAMFESFLLDSDVLRNMRAYMSTASVSQQTFLDPPALVTAAHSASLLGRLQSKYRSFEITQQSTSVASDREKTVWLVTVTDDFATETANWDHFAQSIELRSEDVCSRLCALSPLLDPRTHSEMRAIVEEFLCRQRLSVVCESLSSSIGSLQIMADIPRLCSLTHSLHMHATYTSSSGTEALTRIIGAEGAKKIQALVDKHANRLRKRLHALHHLELSEAVSSPSYRNSAIEFIVSLFERTKCTLSSHTQWNDRFHLAGKTLFNAHKQIEATWEEVLESSVVPQGADVVDTNSLEDPERPLVDTNALANAVYNSIYCRFLSVLLREAVPATSTSAARDALLDLETLARDITGAGLPLSFSAARLPSLLPVATALSLNAARETSMVDRVDDLPLEKMRSLLALAGALPEVSHLKHYLTSLALLLLAGEEVVTLVDQTTASYFLLHEVLGVDILRENSKLIRSSACDGIRVSFGMDSFAEISERATVDHGLIVPQSSGPAESSTSSAIPPGTNSGCLLIITAHSQMLSELQILLLLKRGLLFHCFPMLSKVWRTLHSIASHCTTSSENTQGMFVLAFEVERFNSQWIEGSVRIHRSMRVLSSIMNCLRHSESLDGRVIVGSWMSFRKLFGDMLTEQQQVAIEGELSAALYQWFLHLREVLSARHWTAVMTETLLDLYVDSSCPHGLVAMHRILTQLQLGRGEGIGIEDEAKEEVEKEEEEDEEEDEELEDFRLTDTSRLALKQTLLSISQCLASSYSAHSLVSTYSLNPPSAATNSIVVASIERNLGDWVDWASDVYAVEMPGTGNYRMNWLDKLSVAFVIKPSAVSGLLMAALTDLGLNLPFQSELSEYEVQDVFSLAQSGKTTYAADSCVVVMCNATGGEDVLASCLRVRADKREVALASRVFLARDALEDGLSLSALTRLVQAPPPPPPAPPAEAVVSTPMRPTLQKQESFNRSFRNLNLAVETTNTTPLPEALIHGVLFDGQCRGLSRWTGDLNVTDLVASSHETKLIVFETDRSTVCTTASFTMEAVPLLNDAKGSGTRLDKVLSISHRLSVVARRPVFDDYRLLLQHLYQVVATTPLNCSELHHGIVLRIRWVLIMFHASVIYKLRGAASAVGVDTLVYAFRVVDLIYHKDTATPAPPAPLSVTSTPTASYRPTAVVALEVPHEALDLNQCFELLVHYVGDCLYCGLVAGSHKLQGVVRSTFLSFFTPASCDPCVDYYIQGKVSIPADFEPLGAKQFFKLVNQLVLQNECSYVDLVGSTIAEVNSSAVSSLYEAVEGVLSRLGDSSCSRHATRVTDFLSARWPHRELSVAIKSASLTSIKSVLTHLLSLVPERIKTDSKEILEKMASHKLANAVPEKGKQSESKRRQAKKAAAQRSQQSREFDPLWAYALSECFEYNRSVESMRTQFNELLDCQTDVLHFLADKGVAVAERAATLEVVAQAMASLQDGRVPLSWLGPQRLSDEGQAYAPLRLDEWMGALAERRHILFNWLTLGHPGVIRLHLLRDPHGLFHALKETFALRMETSIEKSHLHYSLLDSAAVTNASVNQSNRDNQGCNITIAGVQLHNAVYSHRNSSLEFLSEFSASTFGQKLVLQVVTSHDEYEVDEEEFRCPLYVAPDNFPSLGGGDLLPFGGHSHVGGAVTTVPIAYVPIATTEDTEDCTMFGIGMYCGSKWRLPGL